MIQETDRFRYIAFDPGGNTFGWSVFDVDLTNNEPVVIAAGTLKRNELLNASHKTLVEKNGEFSVAWKLIGEALSELFDLWRPNAIAYETAHFKRRMVNTYKSLVTAAAVIRASAYLYDPDIYIAGYQPNEGKGAVGVKKGSKDKTLVMKAIAKTKKVDWANNDLAKTLDEHACDSVAIGIAFYDYHFTQQETE